MLRKFHTCITYMMNKKTNIRIGTLYFTYIMYIYLLVDCHEFFIGNVQFFNPKSVYLKWNFPLNPHVCLLFGRGRLVGQSFKVSTKQGNFSSMLPLEYL